MKSMKSIVFSLVMALPLALGSMVSDVQAADKAQNSEAALAAGVRDTAPLIGAWFVELTNGNTELTNPGLYSFLPGGVLHQSETPMTDPMLNNLVFSNAHGAWQYNAEDDSYSIRYFKLAYHADAAYSGKEETTGKLRLDNQGNLVGSISVGDVEFAFVGERITAVAKTQ